MKTAGFERIIASCIRHGQNCYAHSVALMCKRPLNEGEYEQLLRASIERGFTDQAVDLVRLAFKRRLTRGERGQLLQSSIRNGLFVEACRAACLVGRKLTVREGSDLIRACTKFGHLPAIHDVRRIYGRRIRPTELASLANAYLDHGDITAALRLADEMDSVKIINKVLKFCLERGDASGAYKAVKLLRRGISSVEMDRLIERNIERGDLDAAMNAADLDCD